MKRNLVGKILGKIKIFGQDFVPIRTALKKNQNAPRPSDVVVLSWLPVIEVTIITI